MKNDKITIQCDRCGKMVDGNCRDYSDDSSFPNYITYGYYILTGNSFWAQFARWEEEKICDDCMHSDSKYIKMYGNSIGHNITASL